MIWQFEPVGHQPPIVLKELKDWVPGQNVKSTLQAIQDLC